MQKVQKRFPVLNQALPGAARIADRFHLIKDLVHGMTGEIAARSRLGAEKRSFDFPSQKIVRKRIMESLYNMGDEKHRSKLRRFIDAEGCMRKGMSLSETARHLNVHSHVICKLMRGHTSRDYMPPQQKSILKHVDQLAFEIAIHHFLYQQNRTQNILSHYPKIAFFPVSS